MKLGELLEYVHRFQTVDIRDEYGIEIDKGYGSAQDVYDSLNEHNNKVLSYPIRFIQVNNTSDIEIICETYR